MRPAYILALATVSLTACNAGNAGNADKAGNGGKAEEKDAAPVVNQDTVSASRGSAVEDKLLECIEHFSETSWATSLVVAVNGAFKSFFESENLAADFCRWNEQECAAGWQDGLAVTTQLIPDTYRMTFVYDFDAETMDKYLDRIDGELEHTQISCDAKPLPEGMRILL